MNGTIKITLGLTIKIKATNIKYQIMSTILRKFKFKISTMHRDEVINQE